MKVLLALVVLAGVIHADAKDDLNRARGDHDTLKSKICRATAVAMNGSSFLSSGRPDCVKFENEACKVIEFKPDTWSESGARDQASRYVDDVRRKFKDDDRAKKCKRDADGYPIFTPVGETYTACRS